MADPRQPSPRALAMRRRGMLTWGIILTVLWLGVTVPVALGYSSDPVEQVGMAIALQVFVGIPGLLGVIFLVIGISGEWRARQFNTQDWALADALAESLQGLWHQPPLTAYLAESGDVEVRDGRLVEIERHFDAQTSGAITGAMTHRLRLFGSSFSTTYGSFDGGAFEASSRGSFSGTIRGLTQVNLGVSVTTRDNLLGDALFAVLEAPGPASQRDTYRVISMSRPGVASWITDLVWSVTWQLGGLQTHASATVWQWNDLLIARFAPADVSYSTDRLKALERRPADDRELVTVRGTAAGRNAIIVTAMTIGGGGALNLMPARFPAMFGHAVAVGIANGGRRMLGRPQPSLPSS